MTTLETTVQNETPYPIKRNYFQRQKRITRIMSAILSGATSDGEIADLILIPPYTVRKHTFEAGIQIETYVPSKKFPTKRIPSRDRLIRRGLSLQQIADRYKTTRERARQYIKQTGQYEQWRSSRYFFKNHKKIAQEEEKQRKQTLTQVLREVSNRKYNELDPSNLEHWAERKAYEYTSRANPSPKYRWQKLPFSKLITLFRLYKNAKDSNSPHSIYDLANLTNVHYVKVAQILNNVQLPTLKHPMLLPVLL